MDAAFVVSALFGGLWVELVWASVLLVPLGAFFVCYALKGVRGRLAWSGMICLLLACEAWIASLVIQARLSSDVILNLPSDAVLVPLTVCCVAPFIPRTVNRIALQSKEDRKEMFGVFGLFFLGMPAFAFIGYGFAQMLIALGK